jgi:hypothetical protein
MSAILRGMDEVRRKLKEEQKRWAEATKAAQLRMAIDLVTAARQTTPQRTGQLRDSAFVRVINGRDGIYTKAGFGARHAGAIHKGSADRAGGTVKFQLRNGQTKFLAKAVRQVKSGYAARLAKLTRIYYDSRIGPDMVRNPYVSRADQWKAFQRAVRGQMRAERRAERDKWAGFNKEIKRQMRRKVGV